MRELAGAARGQCAWEEGKKGERRHERKMKAKESAERQNTGRKRQNIGGTPAEPRRSRWTTGRGRTQVEPRLNADRTPANKCAAWPRGQCNGCHHDAREHNIVSVSGDVARRTTRGQHQWAKIRRKRGAKQWADVIYLQLVATLAGCFAITTNHQTYRCDTHLLTL